VMGELPTDQLEVIGAVAIRIRDAAVPSGQSGAGDDGGDQPGEFSLPDGATQGAREPWPGPIPPTSGPVR